MSEMKAKLLNAMLESLRAQERVIKTMGDVITEILGDEKAVTNMTYEESKKESSLNEVTSK